MTNRLMCKSNLLDFTAEIERKSKKTDEIKYRFQRGLIQRPPAEEADMLTSRAGGATTGDRCYYMGIFFTEMDEGEMKENRQY